jgi:hypothetical protein
VRGENSNNEYIVGDVVGQYEVKGVVGRGLQTRFSFLILLLFIGSFGVVYLCHHIETGERKAVKVFFHGNEKVFFFFFNRGYVNVFSKNNQKKRILVLG